VERLLHTEDAEERELLLAMRSEGLKVLDDVLTNLARRIVKEQALAEERGRKKQPKGKGK
jgi:hypothetical protein